MTNSASEPSIVLDNRRLGLRLDRALRAEMVAHCLRCFPEEGCGLLFALPGSSEIKKVQAVTNAAASSRIYVVDPRELLRADRHAEAEGLEIVGVFHSHTHTDAYPSPTDVAQAPDPTWHYVLVSLRHPEASIRSYRIVAGEVEEEDVLE